MSKKSITLTMIIIAGIIAGRFGFQFVFEKPDFEKQLLTIASEVNKSCPMMVDKETRLDNCTGGPGKTFSYNYTLINFQKDEIDVDNLQSSLRPRVLNSIKNNPDMAEFRDNKVEIRYIYNDVNGIFIASISIKPEDYLSK